MIFVDYHRLTIDFDKKHGFYIESQHELTS